MEAKNRTPPERGNRMNNALQRTGRAVRDLYKDHSQAVYRVAYSFMKNKYDAEDALQETFLRLIRTNPELLDQKHELGWLILTVSNVCRDKLRSCSRQFESIDDHPELSTPGPEINPVLAAILKLPDKYKAAVYLHYYEGYSAKEISGILRQSPGTVKTWLFRARKALKESLGGDLDD